MCGISGVVWLRPELAVDEATLHRATQVLAYRGPDGTGFALSPYVSSPPYAAYPGFALGHRRLAILDLAGGAQPLWSEDRQIAVIVNGEIYNYRALRRRLEGAGHTFRSDSDSEVIVHLYEELGLAAIEHLAGMFALAIVDRPLRQIVLARDRLGKKPLVYFQEPERLSFASELKSLREFPWVPGTIDPTAVDQYLTWQYVPHPHTMYRGIHKLPPGHYGLFRAGSWHVAPYWQPAWHEEQANEPSAAKAELERLLSQAVERRLQSDVPVGAFLSGGVDSSLVAALAVRQQGRPLRTFTIGFAEGAYDERPYAAQVARHLGTEHEEEIVAADAVSLLPQLVAAFDEPFGDSSAIPTWFLARLARRSVTVALSGDGGDELFLGYDRYRAAAWAHWLDRVPMLRRWLGRWLGRRPGEGWSWSAGTSRHVWLRRWSRFREALALSPSRRYADWVALFNEPRRLALYAPSFLEQLSGDDPTRFVVDAWRRAGTRDPVSCAATADLLTYLPCDLLTKVDVCTMAHGLEARQPLLDHELVEFAARLPAALHYRRGRGKQLLRDTFGPLLPASIWQRRKQGFGVPLGEWLRGPLAAHVHELTDPQGALLQTGWFAAESIEQLALQHRRSQCDHGPRLWGLIVLAEWLKQQQRAVLQRNGN